MSSSTEAKVPLWRDDRFWKIVFQAIVLAGVIILISIFVTNLNRNLARAGLEFSFGFLDNSAGFSIGETPIEYSPNNSYIRALGVGIINTLRVILVGFILTTLLGVIAGIASFSDNWLLRKISGLYVEIVRNVPLLLQLIFWYFPVFLSLPPPDERIRWMGGIFMDKTGIFLPWPTMGIGFWVCLGLLLVLALSAWFTWKQRIRLMVETGASGQPQLIALIIMGVVALLIFFVGFNWEIPQPGDGTRIDGGLRLTLEYSALLVGLVVYTGAFIAEIVRGGIQSVSKGQWEAARSLGLTPGQVMQLVVFPQAMRVIIPPLNSQYMNLAKNSSLALAIGYPDIFSVSSTILNQTGRPVEVFVILMAIYLLINLVISVFMNQLNRMVQFKER